MTKTCAAEAAAERTFSSEAIIHDKIRNSMDPELTSKILKVRWIKQISIRTGLTTEQKLNGIYNDTFDDDVEEEED